MDRLNRFVFRRRSGLMPAFWLPLDDAGSGAVNTTPGIATGSGVATFTRATPATTTLSSGLIANVNSGVARSCYTPAGVYLGYLAEEARTNICLQSAALNVTWGSGALTLGGSASMPDGTTGTVNKLQETAAVAIHFIAQPITKAASSLAYTFSVYCKQAERTFVEVGFDDNAGNGGTVIVNLATGVISTAAAAFGVGFTSPSATVTSAVNGFYKITFTATTNTAATVRPVVALNTDGTTHYQSYLGVLNSGLFAWGAQLEQAAFATSYIPTTTVAVTRNADVLTYPLLGNFSSVAGTAYAEFQQPTIIGSGRIVGGALAEPGTPLASSAANSGAIGFDGTTQVNGPAGAPTAGSVIKCANHWPSSANKYQIAVGGSLGTEAAFDGDFNITVIGIGNGATNPLNGTVKNVRIYKSALTGALLQSMTS